ncbi:hypothetical protein KIPB_008675 [Kipferlia bialata]|uniref:Uncharacterized protein n=1 Tax=Kipferlia bialata TaxID=797122 RepID=A0A391NNE0_9EUKA|nr:hypothetical protein KIPB_008675 [Kipferlia bialata]|eukprot:g8675.t1
MDASNDAPVTHAQLSELVITFMARVEEIIAKKSEEMRKRQLSLDSERRIAESLDRRQRLLESRERSIKMKETSSSSPLE